MTLENRLDIICDDVDDDRIASLLVGFSQHSQLQIRKYKVSQLLIDSGFQYRSDETVQLSDPSRSGTSKNWAVMSRVINLTDYTVNVLSNGVDGLYKGYVSKALEFALNSYARQTSSFGLYSTCGSVLPLPTQYALVQGLEHVHVPSFIYGSGYETIEDKAKGFSNCVFKSPFDFYHWRPGSYDEPESTRFCVDRPIGVPVVSYVMRCHSWHLDLRSNSAYMGTSRGVLETLAYDIWKLFGGTILEILWFLDEDSVVFACASHYCRSLTSFDVLQGFEEQFMDAIGLQLPDLSPSL